MHGKAELVFLLSGLYARCIEHVSRKDSVFPLMAENFN